jgi:alkylresorcinol/alkylpyrone synthase
VHPETRDVIAGTIGDDGLHFPTQREVRATVRAAMPEVAAFCRRQGIAPDWWVNHTGGPQILRAVQAGLGLESGVLAPSWAALAEAGNTSSVSLFHALSLAYIDEGWRPEDGARGGLMGLGPGVTAEMLAGTWQAR